MFRFIQKILSSTLWSVSMLTLFVGMSDTALGQSAVTGAISGTVSDPSGAVIPNTTVTLQSVGTNKEETLSTDSAGRFRFTNLQPGVYALSVQYSGFAEFRRDQIIVEVGRTTLVDATLQVGTAQTEVAVTVDAPLINTETTEAASNINQIAINNLPINGRRWSNFAILTPGSTPDGTFGLISFRGISGLLNNNTVDGGDNNQAFFSEERGRTRISYSISQSAIQEFQVNTSNYSAEYGRAAGGVTNAVTKSGTNELHGDVFYFQRNNKWGARNPLAFQSTLQNGVVTRVGIKPEDVRHQFGGTVGGPIVRDRLFFFFSYDQQERKFPGLGIFSSPNYLETVNRTTLTSAPRNISNAQIDSTLNFLNSLSGTVARRGDQTLFLPKLDWQVNDKHTFTVNYNRLRWDSPAGVQTQATNTRGRSSFGDDFVDIDWGTARVFSTLSSKLINEVRVQYARDLEYQKSQTPLEGEPRTALNGSSPEVFLTNGLSFGKPAILERAKYPDEKRIQITDNMTYVSGPYTVKYGVDINRVKNTVSNLRFESGSYSYNNINDFIIDYVNWKTPLGPTATCSANPTRFAGRCYTSNYQQGFGALGAELSTTDYNAYAQVDWKFRPDVTFNFGLRYEYQQMPGAQNPNPSTQVIPNTQLTLNQATSQLPADKNNFGPRAGVALRLTDDGKMSLRGGYGLYFGRNINSTIYNALVNTGGSGGQAQVSLAPTTATAPVFPNVLASAPAGTGAIQFFSPDYGNPMIHQADLILEREILDSTTVSASYLLSLGRKLPTFYDRNLSAPTATQDFAISGGPFGGQTWTIPVFSTTRPLTGFAQLTEIASNVESTYHALVLQANRQFSRGLQFHVSYTLSKAEDMNQRSATFTDNNTPFNVFDPDGEQGRSNYDRRHKFVVSAVYAPRFTGNGFGKLLDGWSIAPVLQIFTGFPYDAGISGSFGGAGSINRSGGANRLILAERNAFTAPGIKNFDLRLSRRFYVKDAMNVEFLAEGFNVLNRTHRTQVNTTAYNLSGTTLNYNNSFGTLTEASSTLYRERQVQIGFRFNY